MPGAVFLADDRVELRTREREDAAFRRDHVNDPGMRTALGTNRPRNLAYEEAAIETTAGEEDAIRLIICEDGEPVGHVVLWIRDWVVGTGEIGIWVIPAAQGRGVGRAATSLLVTHGFDALGLHRITAEDVLVTNDASNALFESLGFTQEACRRDAAYVGGEYVDTVDYAVLAVEWTGGCGPGD